MPKKFPTKDHAFWLRYTKGNDQWSLIHRLTCGPTTIALVHDSTTGSTPLGSLMHELANAHPASEEDNA